jgi:hypothetical protein
MSSRLLLCTRFFSKQIMIVLRNTSMAKNNRVFWSK